MADAVRRIHETRTMAVVAVAGGASQSLAWLLSVPGASKTVLEVRRARAPVGGSRSRSARTPPCPPARGVAQQQRAAAARH